MTTDVRALPAQLDQPFAATPSARLSRGGGWLTLILALIMLGSMAESLNAAAWSDGLEIVQAATIGGALLGFLLALTRWDGFLPTCYSFLASITWIVTLLDRAIFTTLNLHDSVSELVQRNVAWLVALFSGTPNADNLIFVTQLCFLSWWIGYFAIWSLMRHQRMFHTIIPAGVALLVNLYYAPVNLSGYLLLYLVAVLLLAIRIELARNETRWQIAQIRYAPDIYLDFLRAGVIFAAFVIALAWTMPDIANRSNLEHLLRPFEGSWSQVEDTWARMYRALNYRGETPASAAFGKTMTLSGPVALTDRPIFEAETPIHTYWRAVVFDTYTGEGWLNTDQEVATLERNEPLDEPVFYASREITATFFPLENGQEVVFAPPQPLRVTLPLTVDRSQVPRGEDDAGKMTVSRMRSRLTLARGSSYQVAAAVSVATPEELRTAPAIYPAWIIRRYMRLPEALPERIVSLAQEITAPYDTPYDKASAVEAYLREYTYNQQIAAPPPGWDGVDYFLFDIKEGYCDYYASALAVMLRAVDIPTRLVVGYTPGQTVPPPEDDPAARPKYQVQERNAHAWVEVWFPTFGWIQFEPTASEPLLARPQPRTTDAAAANDNLRSPDTPEEDDLRPERGNLLPRGDTRTPGFADWVQTHRAGLIVGVLAVILSVAGGLWLRRQRLALLADPNLLGRLFGMMETWATRLRIPWPASHTPLEHAAAFNQALPEAEPTVNRVTTLFVAQQYGRQRPPADALTSTAEEWEQLRPLLWKRWLRRLVERRSL
ncbi:MAG: hypothetical protein CVU38_06675 [Chloroflexi bacterium HGW-Chloroflexi-1]|nr:MAG: hypothetical protein CVU38_06675 [Chloroflexi bacterium HGW-Chloroflexi-1]